MRMRFAGIDLGSRTIELVVVNEAGEVILSLQAEHRLRPHGRSQKALIKGVDFDGIMATGYGRTLFEDFL